MFYVSLPLGAVFALNSDEEFHLIGMAIDADGVVTITEATDDLTADIDDYGPFCLMTTEEVIAKFAVTPTTPMLPMSLVTGVPAEATIPQDVAHDIVIDIVALTGGVFDATVASSDEEVATVAFLTDTITITPVAVGDTVITVTVADSEGVYADAVFTFPVTVEQRELVFAQIDDQEIAAGSVARDIPLDTVDFKKDLTLVDVYSSDNEILAVTYADDVTNTTVGTISCTPHATEMGEVLVTVRGVDTQSATTETIMTFKFRVTAAE